MTTYDLDDIRDMIRKGALLYHDREDVARVEDLTQAELEILLHHSTDEVKPFKPGESISSYFFYMAAIL